MDENWSTRFDSRFSKLGKARRWISDHLLVIFSASACLSLAEAVFTYWNSFTGLFIASLTVFFVSGCITFYVATRRKTKPWRGLVTLLLIFAFAALVQNNAQAQKQIVNDDPQPEVLLEICAVLIVGTLLALGGCSIKKKLDTLPPHELPPDDVPPDPPSPTPPPNEPPIFPPMIPPMGPTGFSVHRMGATPDGYKEMPSVPIDSNGNGITRWNLRPYASQHQNTYKDPCSTNLFTDLLTTTIQGQSTLNSPWHVVGSRKIWLTCNTNSPAGVCSSLAVYFNTQGAPVYTNYYTDTRQLPPQQTYDTNAVLAVKLAPWEGVGYYFFRLVSQTNGVGVMAD